MNIKSAVGGVLVAAFFVPVAFWAQQQVKRGPLPAPPQQKASKTTPTNREATGQQARPTCAQQVGISEALMRERRSVMQNARQQVEAVCANPSLNDQQKRQEIHQIRQTAEKEADGLLTPQQLEELRACQRSREQAHPTPPHPNPGVHGNDPCWGIR